MTAPHRPGGSHIAWHLCVIERRKGPVSAAWSDETGELRRVALSGAEPRSRRVQLQFASDP